MFWMVLAGVFALDRASKLWVDIAGRGAQVLIPGLLELRYTTNRGMALGLLSGNLWATLVLPVVAVVVWWLAFRAYQPTTYKRVASAMLLGGFAGNFVDRLLLGYVVDMVYFPFFPWFICNIADIAICAGVVMLAGSLLLRPQDWRETHGKGTG